MFRVIAVCLALSAAGYAQDVRVHEAVVRSVALIQKTQSQWKVPCISCHHQGLGLQALQAARRHGIQLDENAARAHSAGVFGQLRGYEGLIENGGIDIFGHGYALLAVRAGGLGPNITTALLAKRIANVQNPDGHWSVMDGRPPHAYSLFTATAIGTRVVGLYLPERLAAERNTGLARARRWLLAHEPNATEDASFRVLGVLWAGGSKRELRRAAAPLLASQRADGGWSQVPGIASDAYSTGQALYALRQARVLAPHSPRFRNGVRFLLETQQPQGSWHVGTRLHSPSPISPPFFDAGFPNGKDQFISFAGTCWALMALAEALPETSRPVTPLPVPEVQPPAVERWIHTALFGSRDELRTLLDAGLDPNTATKGGVTLLMMASPDRDKMQLLLDRGAAVNAASRSGTTALFVASSYRSSVPAIRLLLARGAALFPDPTKPDNSPLSNAIAAGDIEAVSILLDHGALQESLPPAVFDTAVQGNDPAMVRLLVKRAGANVNQVNGHMTPLIFSAIMHNTAMVQTLLELGADPEYVDNVGYTALRHTADIWYTDPATAAVLARAAASRPHVLASAGQR